MVNQSVYHVICRWCKLILLCSYALIRLLLDCNFSDNFKKKSLDFHLRVILTFRSPFSTMRFSSKIKSLTKQNMFYRLDILHDFSILRV